MLVHLRQAARRFARRPVVSSAAVLALAIGIGSASAMYAVIDAMSLRRPPWPQADRLAIVHAVRPDQRLNPSLAGNWDRAPLSWTTWADLRSSRAFADVGAWMPGQHIIGTIGSDQRDLVSAFHTSSSFWTVLGVEPALGRLFTPDEDRDPADIVILSHEGWRRRLAGNPDVLGATVLVASGAATPARLKRVVGVLAPGFTFQGETPELFLPMGLMAFNGSFESNRFLRAIGRLAPGVSIPQAQAVAEPLVRRSEPAETRTARVVSLHEDRIGGLRRPLWLLLAGAGLLLLIACASVASVLLVDTSGRRNEVGIRTALGATPRHLARQMLAECMILAAAGSVVGVLLATWIAALFASQVPAEVRALGDISISPRVVMLALAVGMTTVAIFGVGPAFLLARLPMRSARSQRGSSVPWHRTIVSGQVAFALLLVIGAGLFGQTLVNLQRAPFGFDDAGVAVAAVRFTQQPVPPGRDSAATMSPALLSGLGTDRSSAMARAQQSWTHTNHLLDQVRTLPGVVAVAASNGAPFAGTPPRVFEYRDATGDPGTGIDFALRIVTEDYFATLGVPLVAGRLFSPQDRSAGGTEAVIVSAAAESRFRSGAALDAQLLAGTGRFRVVGVVGDVQEMKGSVAVDPTPALYSLNLDATQIAYVLVRATGDVKGLLPMIRVALEAEPSVRVTRTATMHELVRASLAEERFRALASSVFAISALLLAAIGVFALTTDRVTRRWPEMALRVALGATASDVRRLILRDALTTVAIGLLVGVLASVAVLRVVGSLLYGMPALPVVVWSGATLVVLLGAIAALLPPAIVVGRVDAGRVLRQ